MEVKEGNALEVRHREGDPRWRRKRRREEKVGTGAEAVGVDQRCLERDIIETHTWWCILWCMCCELSGRLLLEIHSQDIQIVCQWRQLLSQGLRWWWCPEALFPGFVCVPLLSLKCQDWSSVFLIFMVPVFSQFLDLLSSAIVVTLTPIWPLFIICHIRGSNSQPHYDTDHYWWLCSLTQVLPLA